MRAILRHIDHVQQKPHHVRRKVAFATAGGITAVIALLWLGISLTSGVFAIQGNSFAESVGSQEGSSVPVEGTGLAGAAAAPALQPDEGEPRIKIVDAKTTKPAPREPEATIIPF